MALHQVLGKDSEETASLDTYAHGLSAGRLPKAHMPKGSVPSTVAYNLIRDELLLDGNARQNLATFCTTWIEPEVRQLMADVIDKNMIDKDEYPQTAEIESRCVHILADLWHAPDARDDHRLLDHGLERGGDAWRPRAQVAVAQAAGRRRTSRPIARTWCAGRCRCAGRSSPATSTSSCGRFRSRRGRRA